MSHSYLLSLSCIVSLTLCIFTIYYEQDAYCSHTPAPPGVEKQTLTDHVTVTRTLKDIPANDYLETTSFQKKEWAINAWRIHEQLSFTIFTISNPLGLQLLIKFLRDC